MTARQMQGKASKLQFQNCFAVDREGLGGGLAMCWTEDINVEIKSFSKHHVDAVVHSEDGRFWRCTGVYGHPETDQKKNTWELLRRLAGLSSLPWLCFGDFNEVLNLNEKLGGRDRRANLVNDFREALKDCDLTGLGSTGYPFTWSNRRFGVNIIEERLDRFLGNSSWRESFQEKTAQNLISWSSDHSPIMMEVLEKGRGNRYSRKTFHRTHYEDMWSPYEKCKEIVKNEWMEGISWKGGNSAEIFKRISKESLANLRIWIREEFDGRKRKLQQLKKKLKDLKKWLSPSRQWRGD